MDQGMVDPTALRHRALRLFDDFRSIAGDGLLDQTAFVLGDQAFDRSGEVLPEVKTVGDLHRTRRSGPSAFGIRACSVPTDHLWRFVLQQPSASGDASRPGIRSTTRRFSQSIKTVP
jgi:hypothetical protein